MIDRRSFLAAVGAGVLGSALPGPQAEAVNLWEGVVMHCCPEATVTIYRSWAEGINDNWEDLTGRDTSNRGGKRK